MSKVKIVTSRPHRLGAKMNINNKNVTVPSSGVISVDEEVGKNLVENGKGWAYATKADEKKATEEVEEVVADEGSNANGGDAEEIKLEEDAPIEEEKDDEAPDESEAIDLKELTVRKLQDICESAGLPEAEWKKLIKAPLIAYIEKKIK